MAEETITIYRVDTGEAVKSVNDLRENVKALKNQLGDLDIGSQKYQDTLEELKINQNALKDVMYATEASMKDVEKAARGESESYNSLVNYMAKLKAQLRATDVSTAEGMARFKGLASQVNNVNDRLKEMDALQGNYQRNVGNYQSALSGLGNILKGLPPTLGSTKEQLGKVGETLNMVGKQPVLGIVGLLAPLIMKITSSLKENETATNAINKALGALKPIMDLVSRGLETIAGWVSKAVDWFVSLAGESGESFKRIISGAVGVGNALLQYLLTPIRTVVDAFKGLGSILKDIFTGDFKSVKEDALTAAREIGENFRTGFSFKANFAEGQKIGEEFMASLGSAAVKKAANDAGVEIGRELADGIDKGLVEIQDGWQDKMDPVIAARGKAMREAAALQEELDQSVMDDTLATQEFVNGVLAEIDAEQEKAQQSAEEKAKARAATIQGLANTTSSILGSLADMYEADAEGSEKNANKIKALRIASATIDTISGAVGAYTQAAESIPPPYGIILGAAQAATVTAAGLAQIAKMKSTNVSGSGSSGSVGAVQSAPAVTVQIPQSRSITSASEEDRLNRMSSDQRVVLVTSELEMHENQQKVRLAEATFG